MSRWATTSVLAIVLALAVVAGATGSPDGSATRGPSLAAVVDASQASEADTADAAAEASEVRRATEGRAAPDDVAVLGAVEEREAPQDAVASDAPDPAPRPDPPAEPTANDVALTEGFDIIIGAGQSNMSGRGSPVTDDLHPPHPRVFEYGAPTVEGGGEIRPAGHTLRFPDRDANADVAGLSPLRVIGDRYADANPGRRVLLVPTAAGGSGLVTDRPSGHWRPGGSGRGGNRYDAMLTHTREALAAAGPGSRIVALAWQQGESDAKAGVPEAEYAALLDELITTARDDLGVPDLPVVVGQMAPDWIAEAPERQGVDRAHMNAPGRLERVGFAYGPRDVAWLNPDGEHDTTHYSLDGVRQLGDAMAASLEDAIRNVASSAPVAPRGVAATRDGSEVRVTWPWPRSRVTDYRVEWRVGAGPWSSDGVERYATLDTAAEITGVPAGFLQVRVAAIDDGETSPWAVTAATG